jgi:hypothetical protein
LGTKELPKELPPEYQEKFEIRDAGDVVTPAPQPSASPSPSPTPRPKPAKPPRKPRRARGKHPAPEVSPSSAPGLNPSPIPAAQATAPDEAVPSFAWPHRRPAREYFWVGEKLTYDITYFGMVAGDFTTEVLPLKVINNRKVYHARGTAKSSSVFSLFYKLNDSLETFFDYEGLFSHRFHILLDESKQSRDSLELYDSEKAQTYYWNRWNHKTRGYTETKDFFPIRPFPQDSFSALFYLRTLPLKTGEVYTFPVVSEGKTWDAVVTVVGRGEMDTPVGRLKVIKLKPETKYQGILQKRGDSYLWLSDDDRRFLVRLEAKVKIGTVVGQLKKIEYGTRPEGQ